MKDIWLKIQELLDKGETLVMATIIRRSGSAPRGVGSKCLIMEEGPFVGSIGGGILESRVIEEAKSLFKTRLPKKLEFSLKDTDVADVGMVCGGNVEVFLEPLAPGPNLTPVVKAIRGIYDQRGAGILATAISTGAWKQGRTPMVLFERGGRRIGSLTGDREWEDLLHSEVEEVFNAAEPRVVSIRETNGCLMEIFLEPVASDPVLYVFGCGHLSKEIVHLANHVGFQVVVSDDRSDFADPERFPNAREVYCFPFEEAVQRLPVDGSSYLVIVTRGHMHDKVVLGSALRTEAAYIGMIGSRRKRDTIYASLKDEGFTGEDLSRVHCPIGLQINARTPEEIAVSIVAELIMVKSGRRAGNKDQTSG